MSPTTWGPTSPSLSGAVLSLGGSFGPSSDRARVRLMRVSALRIILTALVLLVLDLWCVPPFGQVAGMARAAAPSQKHTPAAAKTSPVIAVAQQYAEAIASGDRVAFGRLDFGCQFALVSTAPAPRKAFPPESDPIYGQCWTLLVQAHDTAIEQRDEGVNAIWPGNEFLVFYKNGLTSYPPSFYVMDRLGLSPPGGGLRVEPMDSASIPAGSFRMRPAALQRMAQYAEQRDRVALLNRVLIVNSGHVAALTMLTGELYRTLLSAGAAAHHVLIGDAALAGLFNELYWNAYAQASRIDLSYPRNVIGPDGVATPTPADYLYRMLPAMEKLARLQPDDLENRIRLGNAYRWSNDAQAAIATHEAVVNDITPDRAALKARALLELAWSRIAKVVLNRMSEDPGLVRAYNEAEDAFTLTARPIDKFTAAYTMACGLAYMPNRDLHAMLEKLTEARKWYLQLAGASYESWRYLLLNDTLKGVVEADPDFKPLLTDS